MPLILMTYGAAWFVLVSVKFSGVMGWLIKVSLLPSRVRLAQQRTMVKGGKYLLCFCSSVRARSA